MRALIVDDSKVMRTLVRRILAQCDFDECVEAENGARALEVMHAGPLPDMVFVDWNMPEMSGIEFVRAVRADADLVEVVLMMVTSESGIEQLQTAIEAGADEYLMKPFTAEVLQDKVALIRAQRS